LKGTCPHGDSDPLCGVPARIHGIAPRARFIYLLRDPVTRTYSSYWHSVRQGKNISFSEAIRDEDGFLLRTSDYYGQLEKYLEFFPLESFLFLVFEDMTADPAAAARHCFTFLGVEPRDFSVAADSAKKNVSFTYRPAAIMLRQLFPSWSSWNEFVESAKEHTPRPLRSTVATLFTSKIPPMGEQDRQRLIEYFREPNARLEQLTGIRFNRWQR
jgi:hypothetical protein